jgi:hypothetical protein
MRTVLLGTDFVYDKNNILKPIEINTSTTTSRNKLESPRGEMDFVFNNDNLISFINDNNFTEVVFIGTESELSTVLSDICQSINVTYEFVQTVGYSITIPYVEDSETKLIIRQSYDTTALVDDTYCRDKIEFMKLIQEQPYGSQFAYKDDSGTLISTITTIEDNGTHPNFILKSRYPDYDKAVYPKLYKVSNQEELDIVLENVDATYFLMPYYFNQSKIVNNKVTKIRSLNILYPPTLESFQLGQYTDTTLRYITDVTYDSNTFELDNEFNRVYITSDKGFNMPKLIDTDLVQLSDGTFKTALELQVGDELKTIIVPNADNVSYMTNRVNYEIDIETFLSGAIYTTNTVKAKYRIENEAIMSTITFTDNSTWQDTANSLYLVVNNEEVKFLGINQLVAGDLIILIDTTDTTTVQSITKEVQSVATEFSDFYGWIISVDKTHIFLTKTAEGISDSLFNYATLEHNCYSSQDCPKYDPYCTGAPGSCAQVSDIRFKKNIEYKYTSLDGLKIYTFEYNDNFVINQKTEFNEDYSGKWQGVMAQDLIGTNYESAVISEGNYYKVDYNKLNTKLIKL